MERRPHSYKYGKEGAKGHGSLTLKRAQEWECQHFFKSFSFYIFAMLRIEYRASDTLGKNSTFKLQCSGLNMLGVGSGTVSRYGFAGGSVLLWEWT